MPEGSVKTTPTIVPARTGGRRPTGRGAHRTLRLLLAFVLAVFPLLSLAQTTPDAAHAGEAGLPMSAMPCHGATIGQPVDAAADRAAAGQDQPPGCPHCAGDAAASACLCAGLAGPVGPATTAYTPMRHDAGQTAPLAMVSDALPDSPGERLFRPPIVAC